MGIDIGKWLHGVADLESSDADGDHLAHFMESDFLQNNTKQRKPENSDGKITRGTGGGGEG